MKICFGLGDYSSNGGIEKVTIQLANSLRKKMKYQVYLLSLEKKGEVVFKLRDDIKVNNLNNKISLHNRKKNIFSGINDFIFIILNILKIRKYLKKEKIDYIVGSDIKLTLLFYLASLKIKTKVIGMEHFEYDVPSKILQKIRKLYYKNLYKVVTLTKEDFYKYEEIGLKEKIEVIPNIVFYNKEINHDINSKRIISVGRLTYQKGYDLLIEVWNRIEKQFPDWKLDIFGEGEDKIVLLNKIKELELKNIKINNFTKNIDAEYQKSSFYVMSSRFEGLPTVLIEALSFGLPIISFECPAGPKTIVLQDINGELVKNYDIEEFQEKMKKLMNSFDLRKKYTNNARIDLYRYSEDDVLKKWEKLFSLNK